MTIRLEEAIRNFYKNNNIQPAYYTDSMEEAYLFNKHYDVKIALPALEKRAGKWIQLFEKEDREYFLRLLESFTYITKEALAYRIYCLCGNLFKNFGEMGINRSEVLFVVMESPGGIKSGADEMAINLWSVNQENDLGKDQIITVFSKVRKEIIEKAKAVVFLDDIIASGFTMRGQIEDFLKRFESVCDDSKVYYYTGVLASRSAIQYIKKKMKGKAVRVCPFFSSDQIIRSAFKGDYIFGKDIVEEAERVVKKYEDMIDAYENKYPEKSFSMGFHQCKLLLAFHYETPNNTLCSFWKATDKNTPVFARSGHSRLSVDALKNQKTHMKENAYLYKSINRGVRQ